MSLRYLVPTLGLLACTAGSITAADVGGLTVNGYVDTILAIESYGDDITPIPAGGYYSAPGTGGEEASNMVLDWNAAFQLEPSYKIGNDIVASAEILFVGDDGRLNGQQIDIERAMIKWAVTEMVDITMGKMHSPIGWEGDDAPELFRVNFSNLQNLGLYGWNDLTGVRVGFSGPKGDIQVSGGLLLCDQLTDADISTDNSEFGIVADVTVAVEKLGEFSAALGYDQGTGADETGEPDDVLLFNVNGTLKLVEEKLTVGAEINFVDAGNSDAISILAMGNYKLPVDMPTSVTLMLDYAMLADDGAAGSGDDVEMNEMEIAVALLMNPTKDANFATNVEIRSISRDLDVGGSTVDIDADEFGIFFEMLAVIP